MKLPFLFLLLIATCTALPLNINITLPDIKLPLDVSLLNPTKILNIFGQFKQLFKKRYESKAKEDNALKQFGENLKKIIALNLKNKGKSLEFGVNAFSDLSTEEFRKVMLIDRPEAPSEFPIHNHTEFMRKYNNFGTIPASLDWRTVGHVVSPVKNQGQCGSCWAFSIIGCVEGALGVHYNWLYQPSVQQITDCAMPQDRAGCNGGWLSYGLRYVRDNGLAEVGGYHAYDPKRAQKTNMCDDKKTPKNFYLNSFFKLDDKAEVMKTVLFITGPMSVAFQVGESFHHYKSGVYDMRDCEDPKAGWHAMLIVGYGTENGKDYWIVKNSWDTWWGDKGYIKFARGNNLCQLERADTWYAIA